MPPQIQVNNGERLSDADIYNEQQGELSDYHCTDCKNKGYVASMNSGQLVAHRCKCFEARRTINQMRKAGIDSDKTFDNYQAKQPWQAAILKKAKAFTDNPTGWLYVGGQVGAGKTHICTAVVNAFIAKGLQCSYMMWKNDGTKLKACINEASEYAAMLDKFKRAQVLYIDDFFKTRPNESPTNGDLNLAFELINHRYNDKRLITIISSELSIQGISFLDEAISSRIFERSKDFCIDIKKDSNRNYRMNGNG